MPLISQSLASKTDVITERTRRFAGYEGCCVSLLSSTLLRHDHKCPKAIDCDQYVNPAKALLQRVLDKAQALLYPLRYYKPLTMVNINPATPGVIPKELLAP